jgi:hypothetical protein
MRNGTGVLLGSSIGDSQTPDNAACRDRFLEFFGARTGDLRSVEIQFFELCQTPKVNQAGVRNASSVQVKLS